MVRRVDTEAHGTSVCYNVFDPHAMHAYLGDRDAFETFIDTLVKKERTAAKRAFEALLEESVKIGKISHKSRWRDVSCLLPIDTTRSLPGSRMTLSTSLPSVSGERHIAWRRPVRHSEEIGL